MVSSCVQAFFALNRRLALLSMHRLGMNLCCVETLAGMEAFNLAAPFKGGKARRENENEKEVEKQ